MVLLGTAVNALLIVIGGALGLVVRGGLPKKVTETVIKAVALSVVLIGLSGALEGTAYTMHLIIYLVIGSVIGGFIDIERRLEQLGTRLEKRFSGRDAQFAKGFVTASLIFCIGAMAVMGALESGLKGEHGTLYSKAVLDGITALIFASTMGLGVLFSAAAVLVYQGAIALLAGTVAPVLTDVVVLQMSAVGGLLILGLGLNMLLDAKIKVGNMLPAVFLPMIYQLLF